MTNTTESQITSGKAESTIDTPEFRERLYAVRASSLGFDFNETVSAFIAHIEAVCEKDREEAARDKTNYANQCIEDARKMRERAEKAEAERDHWKAIAERQAADPDDLTRYTPAVDPEFGNAYCTPNPKGGFLRFADVKLLLSPAQQEPAKDVWTDGINPAHVAAYDTALKEY